MSTELGTCQVVFARRQHDVEIDLVLTGPGAIEGYPLVPRSPVAVCVVPPHEAWERRRMLRTLRGWADAATACDVGIDFQEDEAVLTIRSASETLTGFVTDLDVLFASDAHREHTEK